MEGKQKALSLNKTFTCSMKSAYLNTPSKQVLRQQQLQSGQISLCKQQSQAIHFALIPKTLSNFLINKRRKSAPQNNPKAIKTDPSSDLQNPKTDELNQLESIIYTDQIMQQTDQQGKKHINQFTILETIGKGAFSKVKRVLRIFDDTKKTAYYAMKIMHKPTLSRERSLLYNKKGQPLMSDNLQKVYNEIDIWAGLMHPNIVRLFELIDDDAKDYMYLVMELIPEGQISHWDHKAEKYVNDQVICNNLRKYLKTQEFKKSLSGIVVDFETQIQSKQQIQTEQQIKQENLSSNMNEEIKEEQIDSQDIARYIFKDVLQGIHFLHQNLISHRDLKLDNILYSSAEHCAKVSDFTVSKRLLQPAQRFRQCQGTTSYMGKTIILFLQFNLAPQLIVIDQAGYDPLPIDIWSFGVCIFIFMTGTYPFDGDGQLQMQLNIRDKQISLPQSFSDQLKDLINKCLHKDPRKRPTASQLLGHHWFKFRLELEGNYQMNQPSELEQFMKNNQMQIQDLK